MTLTKYDHACMILEEQGSKVIIDPGMFTSSLPDVSDVVAVVITHYHGDHIDPAKVKKILELNPDAVLYATQQTKDNFSDLPITAVTPGESITAGPFHLSFCGGDHAVIHPARPTDQNIGVMVNNEFYYPGDSFAEPPMAIRVLALPAAAPWLKISESMDYVMAVKPQVAIPVHDAILSDAGKQVHDGMITSVTEKSGTEYKRLASGEQFEI
jgi:L-ascorbate metabolism protein UlaG (beta-lactamase superfamily)